MSVEEADVTTNMLLSGESGLRLHQLYHQALLRMQNKKGFSFQTFIE